MMAAMRDSGLSFGQVAGAYQAFRPAYPQALFDLLFERTEGRSLAVDLGTGTGRTLGPLLDAFDTVIAVEPDPGMAAHLPRSGKLRYQIIGAEDAVLPEGEVDLFTCGTAFHWMDGPVVLTRIAPAAKPQALFAAFFYSRPNPGPAGKKVIEGEFKLRWNRFKHDRLNRHGYTQQVLANHPAWTPAEVVHIPNPLTMTLSEFVGFYSSTSYGSAYLRSLEDPQAYVVDLTARLADAIGAETFPVTLPIEVAMSRPAGGAQ